MEIDIRIIEKLKNDFAPRIYYGKSLPEKLSVSDGTVFFLESSSIMIEHIMIKGKWWKKIVDSSSQVVLKEV